MELEKLLKSIGSTEESSFSEICQGLGDDCPAWGDREAWGELFGLLSRAERQGLIEVTRINGKIDGAILTEEGVARLKKA